MNEAVLRFYEELNDFLPISQRKRDIPVRWEGPCRARDLIESFGVPLRDVDLLLIHGEPQGLDAPVQHGDRLSVYPMFERFDISGLMPRAPLRRPLFMVDSTVSKLEPLLQRMGLDVKTAHDDDTLIEQARREHRIILTRNPSLLRHEAVTHGIFLQETRVYAQAREVVRRLQLEALVKPARR